MTVLVLGILGLVICGILAPVAWVMGQSYENECRAMGVRPDGAATAGKILGMVGTILIVLWILVIISIVGKRL